MRDSYLDKALRMNLATFLEYLLFNIYIPFRIVRKNIHNVLTAWIQIHSVPCSSMQLTEIMYDGNQKELLN